MSRDRIRKRGGALSSHVTTGIREYCWDNVNTNYYGQYASRSSSSGEFFYDRVGSRSLTSLSGRVPAYNPAQHHKWTVNVSTGAIVATFGSGGAGVISCALDTMARLKEALGFSLADATTDVGEAVAGALLSLSKSPFYKHKERWDRVKPTMTSRANLFQFLVELKDLKRMFDVVPSKHISIDGLRSVKGWHETLKYVNSGHLNFNFGVKPFARDIRAVFQGLNTFNQRFDRFLENAGSDLTRGASDSVEENSVLVLDHLGAMFKCRITYVHTVTWNSRFYFRYSVPKYCDQELFVRAYLDTLGLNLTPKTIWAVLPWSFVVDWFADVSGYLDQYSNDWLQPEIQFVQAGSSVKGTIKADIDLVKKTTDAGQVFRVGSARLDYFKRAPGVPNFQFDQASLDADKIRLLASLIASRAL